MDTIRKAQRASREAADRLKRLTLAGTSATASSEVFPFLSHRTCAEIPRRRRRSSRYSPADFGLGQ